MNKEVELVDLVDSTGNIQKTEVLRSEIDRFPNLYLPIVIGAIFDSQQRILVHRRSLAKKVDPGKIDHVCGGILSGEKPEDALKRESIEETGIEPTNLKVIVEGINKYKRYRYLLVGESDDAPGYVDPSEVEWVEFISIEELQRKRSSGEFIFVDEFFDDTDLALKNFMEKTK